MRICIVALNIVPYFRPETKDVYGGADVQAAFLARTLADAGHDVGLVVSDLPEDGLPFHAYNAFRRSDGVRGFRFFYPRLTGIHRALARAEADIYYQRNASMVTGITAMFCKAKGKVFIYGAGSDTDFSFREVVLPGPTSLRDKLLYYAGLRLAHGIVVQNETQRKRCLESVKRPAIVIPNGVSVDAKDSNERREHNLWIGALRRLKQPELFIELARRMPDERFVLIGGLSNSEKDFGRDIMQSASVLPNVEVAGHLSHERLLAYIRRSLALVNTSRFEGFPNAFLEAWSCGVPVISFNDVDQLITTEGLGGIARDVSDMATMITTYRNNLAGWTATGERSKKIVENRFSGSALGEKYSAFFQKILERNRNGHG
jgi:glycosyltransferase involved in cell wall biosynthesis